MKFKLALALVALASFLALPAWAQHGSGGHGGDSGMHGSSMHGDSDSHSGHGDSDADTDHDSGSKHSKSQSHDHDGQKSVSAQLSAHPQLASKLAGLLPAGTNLQQAAQGFKNLGQFVAAVHVSHNLGIPFDQLKAKMIGPPPESLGKAIHQLKPDVNAKAATKEADHEADADLKDSKKS